MNASPEKLREEWTIARSTVANLLYQKKVSQREWQDLFMIVYRVVSWWGLGKVVIKEDLQNEINKFMAQAEVKMLRSSNDADLLRTYVNEWEVIYKQSEIIRLPFKMMEGCTEGAKTPNSNSASAALVKARAKEDEESLQLDIQKVVMTEWRERIFLPYALKLRSHALQLVEADRNGEIVEERLVVAIMKSYDVLWRYEDKDLFSKGSDVYVREFEKFFIMHSILFYKSRTQKYLEDYGMLQYMSFADEKIKEELVRGRKYLRNSLESLNKYMDSITRTLVGEYMDVILQECDALVRTNNIEKLALVYRLLRRTPQGLDSIVSRVDEFIRSEGVNDMKNNAHTIATDAEKYVSALLGLFDRFSLLVENAFENDARMLTTRDKAFEYIVNDTSYFNIDLSTAAQRRAGRANVESKCPELLANYCDLLLRKSQLSKKLSSEEIDARIASLLLLLKYVKNKDVFMRFHKAHLARRLILEMCADEEKEEQLALKLKECGMPAELVNRTYKMQQDIELNRGLNAEIRQSLRESHPQVADIITVKILNMGTWGKGGEKIHVSLPAEAEDVTAPIEAFYSKKHMGRKLNWLYHWHTATTTFRASNGAVFDLEVTAFQLAVLFCWNGKKRERLSLESLRTATQMPDSELQRTLYGLTAFPKIKHQVLLTSLPHPINPKKFTDSTEFWLNFDFRIVKNGREQQRGKLNMIGRLQLSMEAAAKAEHADIIALRELRVQEAIVKLMKSRRELPLQQMESEIIYMLKSLFVPSKSMLKEQVEWLVEHEYLARKEDKMEVFIYRA